MDLLDELGPEALTNRVRQLSHLLTAQQADVYALCHVPLKPRWFEVFYTVASRPGLSVRDIALQIGQPPAAVGQAVRELVRQGLVQGGARQRQVTLSAAGAALWPLLQQQVVDMHQATAALLTETRHLLGPALAELEAALARESLASRVAAVRAARVSQRVRILLYEPRYAPDFKRLNVAWIEKHFALEEADLKILDHPEDYILQPGGQILLAEYQGEVVGTCALVRMNADTLELAKMAVSPAAQGLGIGQRLAQAALDTARRMGARRVYLESNTGLGPAIQLYRKLGFRETVPDRPSPYERVDIHMELLLAALHPATSFS